MNGNRKSGWIALAIVLTFLGAWELAVRIFEVPIYILPAPSRTLVTLFNNPTLYLEGLQP